MSLNLDKLVSSENNYEKNIKDVLDTIRKDKDLQSIIKKVILFCKCAFSVTFAQRKKFLCLTVPPSPPSSSETSPKASSSLNSTSCSMTTSPSSC